MTKRNRAGWPAWAVGAVACALWLILPVPAAGQTSAGQTSDAAPTPAATARTLAEGWSALGAGDLAGAARAAQRALGESPGSVAAVALAVDVEAAMGRTVVPGLDAYEQWLDGRRVEAPYVLRRIAQAHLRRIARHAQHAARYEAARLLIADGDRGLAAEISSASSNQSHPDATLLASVRDDRGVKALIDQLRAPGPGKLRTIHALVESGSAAAVPALLELLEDPREEHRAGAADALGKLRATRAIPRLQQCLQDPAFPVRVAAASALYRMEDLNGVGLLEQLLASEHASVRLAGAQALSPSPGGSWEGVVRGLAADPDESVRLGAARLIAPYDAVLASQVLTGLASSGNLAVREEAQRIFVAHVSADFGGLRRALRSADGLTSARAAGRLLELTR